MIDLGWSTGVLLAAPVWLITATVYARRPAPSAPAESSAPPA
ncbi:hypothetical protein O7614_10260 [Micromonospora sp. WMMD961]|nr:hypothetical protein [Micromonospora sp. WMMD961]MDG4780023.1 hypothetical protein [Micromonospora sp. WMMD961]